MHAIQLFPHCKTLPIQTFVKLRELLSDDDVDLPSYKFHFNDLDMFKDEVFDFVRTMVP